jgi:outer membrane protein with beta-barrel domain
MKSWSRLAVLAVCLFPASAYADEARSHDGGFFFRASLGGGVSHTKFDSGSTEAKIKGPSGSGDVALGFGVGKNLILHANVGGWAIVDPTIKFNDVEFDTDDVSVNLSHLGGGLTYYFGDSNVFVTGFAGIGRLDAEVEGEESGTDNGFAAGGGLGKEWWVGDRFGIGVMGSFETHSIPEQDLDDKWKGTSLALQVTFTVN